jgi:diguanylate cyclase (GGDEF)-like protein/PAS domain S-box-containing protein
MCPDPLSGRAGIVSGLSPRRSGGQPSTSDREAARLAALRRFKILDTSPESAFDDLVALAGQLCGTPIALVSLVDSDRQWFKARLGLEVCETSRESSFCAHALNAAGVMVVPDATLDPRFVDNPLVTGAPNIRFYAGAPLVTESGAVMGTLCVIDVIPRTLTPLQLQQLGVLSRQVVDQLELRRSAADLAEEVAAHLRAERQLRETRHLFDDVIARCDIAVYVKDLDGRFLVANPALQSLVRRDERGILGHTDYDVFPTLTADASRRHDQQIVASGAGMVFVDELPHPDGTLHRYRSTRFPLRKEDGTVYAVAGLSTDVTEIEQERRARGESEHRWQMLVEHSPVAVAVIGQDGRFAYANPRAVSLYGAPSATELIGQLAADFVPQAALPDTKALFSGVLHRGQEVLGRRWTMTRLDQAEVVVEINAARIRYLGQPAVQVELRDMSRQAAAEAALQASEARFRALFECSPVGTSECLPDGTILSVNEQMCRMLGYTAEELIGEPASMLLTDADAVDQQHQDLLSLRAQPAYFAERTYRRKNGEQLPVLVGVGVVRDGEGNTERVLGTVVDLTRQVTAEAALRAARDDLVQRQAFTDAVLETIDVGVVACDAAGHLTLFNDASRAWHGLNIADGGAHTLDPTRFPERFDLFDVHGRHLSPGSVPLVRALRDGSVHGQEIVISPKGLPATRAVCSGRAMVTVEGRVLGAVVAMTDVTEAHARTRELEASEHRFRTTFVNAPAGLALLAPNGRAVQVNPAFCDLLGQRDQDLLEMPSLIDFVSERDRTAVVALCRRAFRELGTSVVSERQVLRRDGRQVWVLLTVTQLPDPREGNCLLLQVEDIDAKKEAEARLTRQAQYDGLTDLPNRATLHDRTTQALTRMRRRPDDGVTVMLFCDLDGFKAINDQHGHAAGDHVLVEIAQRLVAALRPDDTVARLGGDEFVVLCEHLTHFAEAAVIAQRIEKTIASPISWGNNTLRVTTSLGIAQADSTLSADELIRRADAAMYQAKRLGKQRRQDDQRDRMRS